MINRTLTNQQMSYALAGGMGFTIAIALAFFVIAMPSNLFEALVTASGVPSLVPAAQPPLGGTARTLVALVTGAVFGGITAGIFLLFDKKTAVHRSAPTPIRASKEFGEIPFSEEITFVRPQSEQAPERLYFDLAAIRAASDVRADTTLELADWPKIEEQAESIDAEAVTEGNVFEEPDFPAKDAIRKSQVTKVTEKTDAITGETIMALMQRLEAGLERRTEWGVPADKAPQIEPVGPGLRSTLEELRKMASRP